MAPLKSVSWSRKDLLPVLIGFAMLYQLIYNIMLYSAVQKELGQDECLVAGGPAAQSPRCLEVRLFRKWQEAEANNAEENIGILRIPGGMKKADESDLPSPITVLISNHTRHLGEILEEHNERMEKIMEEHEQRVMESRRQHAERVQKRSELFDQLEKKVRASMNTSSKTSPWAKDLMDLQSHLESEAHSLDEAHERRAKMDRLEKSLRASLDDADEMTPWAKELVELQSHLEEEMKSNAHHHGGHKSSGGKACKACGQTRTVHQGTRRKDGKA